MFSKKNIFLSRGNRRSGKGNLPRPKKKPKKVEKKKRRGNPHSSDRDKKLKAFVSSEEEIASSSDDVVKECRFCGNPEHSHTECLKCGCAICDSEGESVCWICLQCDDDSETSREEPRMCPDCGDTADSDGHDHCDYCGEGFCYSSDMAMHICFASEEKTD